MTQTQIIKLVRAAYDALAFLDQKTFTHYRQEIFELCRKEEKGHRGWGPDFSKHHTSDTASVADCAKLFVVHRIAEYLLKVCGGRERLPVGKDYLHTQHSCFYAAALADEYHQEILAAWSKFDITELAELDYTAVVHVKES